MTQLRNSAAALLLLGATCAAAVVVSGAQEAQVSEAANLQTMTARFAPTEIGADLANVSRPNRQVLAKLVQDILASA